MKVITTKWLDEAACLGKGTDMFFADTAYTSETKKIIAKAKTFCKSCPVAADCLQYAINNEERFGVWGSFSAKERGSIMSNLGTKTISKRQAEGLINRSMWEIKEVFKNTIFIEEK